MPTTLFRQSTSPMLKPMRIVTITAEYEAVVEALKQTNFNKSKAAELLSIDRKTLYNILKEYDRLKKAIV